jgi:hypothetical protein
MRNPVCVAVFWCVPAATGRTVPPLLAVPATTAFYSERQVRRPAKPDHRLVHRDNRGAIRSVPRMVLSPVFSRRRHPQLSYPLRTAASSPQLAHAL